MQNYIFIRLESVKLVIKAMISKVDIGMFRVDY